MQQQLVKLSERFSSMWKNHIVKGTIISLVLAGLFSSIQYSGSYLQTNLIYENAADIVFNGTVMPLPQTVSWNNLPEQYWNANFADVPADYKIPLNVYKPEELAVPANEISYSDPRRNAKITYSVPYLGNYELDGRENVGSHPAIDIKALAGTPVVSVANGIVTKVSHLESGFGKHVVVLHPNVPSFEDSGQSTNYMASYSHLMSVAVKEGDRVQKGQTLGLIGDTGFATTEHLHFQMDKESASWHPYWPFSGQEATAAGLTFVDAINAGLGIENGREHTINAMLWVQKWLNSDDVYEGSSVVNSETNKNTDAVLKPVKKLDVDIKPKPKPIDKVDKEEVKSPVIEPVKVNTVNDLTLEIKVEGDLIVDKEAKLKLKLLKSDGVKYDYTYHFANDPLIIDADGVKTRFVNGMLEASNFVHGESELVFVPRESGRLRFNIKNDNFVVSSESLVVNDFVDIQANTSESNVINYLRKEGVIHGYPDGTFQPERSVSRVEALKFTLESVGVKLDVPKTKVAFMDVDNTQWYIDYLAVAIENGVIHGDPDGMLRPSEQVNVVEFLKMIYSAMQIDLDPEIDAEYSELIDEDMWYAKYLQEGLRMGIVDYELVKNPDKGLTRMEVANIVYSLKKVID